MVPEQWPGVEPQPAGLEAVCDRPQVLQRVFGRVHKEAGHDGVPGPGMLCIRPGTQSKVVLAHAKPPKGDAHPVWSIR